ncbi:hypothetical protein [Neptuniibacter sp. QD37_11]|uniref:hypothetical protein n=1 Tax=Neptuniibacter sp. QD37_11 TaxID=3398209 RepID=UPI0039F5780E
MSVWAKVSLAIFAIMIIAFGRQMYVEKSDRKIECSNGFKVEAKAKPHKKLNSIQWHDLETGDDMSYHIPQGVSCRISYKRTLF